MMAFCGDTLNPYDVWLGLDESTPVSIYLKSLESLKESLIKMNISIIHTGHSFKHLKISLLDDYIKLCNKILSDDVKSKNVDRGICKGKRSKYRKANLIWKTK